MDIDIRDFFDREVLKMVIETTLILVLVILAYNVGHYDSIQYQKWFDDCGGRYNFTPNLSYWDQTGININISRGDR